MDDTRRAVLAAATALALVTVLTATLLLLRSGDSRGDDRGTAAAAGPTKVLVVIEGDLSYRRMRFRMPALHRLAQRYGYATSWRAIRHPGLPNYLAIAGGSTFGVSDSRSPLAHYLDVGGHLSVFQQALNAGRTAKTYADSMPTNCLSSDYPDRRQVSRQRYVVRHNPWVYFRSNLDACQAHDVPTRAFRRDAAGNRLPNVGFLIPDLCHGGDRCSPARADGWLRRRLAPVLASTDFTSGRLVVVVTASENSAARSNRVLTAVLTPRLSGKVVDTPLTHYSLTRYIADVLHVSALRKGAQAPDMRRAFGL
jgi:phosphatidylinositol-3-phosphatase